MHAAAVVATWVALLAGLAALALGLLRRRRHRDLRRAQVLAGVGLLLETVPRLAGWSSLTVLVLSVLALAPLAGFCYLAYRSRPASS